MRKYLLFIVLLAMSIIVTACGDDDGDSVSAEGDEGIQKVTAKFSHVTSENTPKHQGALAMKEYIEEASDGKIDFQIYPNSSLFGDQDEYQNLVANNIQFIAPDLPKFVGNNPQFNVPALPFLFPDDESAMAFWDGEHGQDILESLEKDGVTGLAAWPNGGKHLTNNVRPIESPEDLKGLKFRTQGGKALEMLYTTLDAGAESIPFGELYTALDQGVVDGQENTFSNIESKKFHEVQKYLTVMNHTRVDYGVFTNTEFWEGLNEETRKIFEEGLEKGTEVARAEATKLNEESYEKIKESGEIEIIELTPEQIEAFREALHPVYKEFEDVIGKDVIDSALELSAE